jgi:replicative DNA helicase
MLYRGPTVAGPLIPADFSHSWYRDLFTLIKQLGQDHPGVDIGPVEVKDELFRLHREHPIPGFADKVYDVVDVFTESWGPGGPWEVERILEAAEARLVQTIGTRMASNPGPDAQQLLADAQADLQSIRIRRGGTDQTATRLAEHARQAELRFATTTPTATPTGLADLDHMLHGGLRPDTFNVLGGRPGTGKSLFAATISRNFAEAGKRVLYVTLELTPAEITNRLLANVGNIELTHLQNPDRLSQDDHHRWSEARIQVEDWPLHIEGGSRSITQVETLAGGYLAEHQGLLVVDFLGRIREDGTATNRERHVSQSASRLTDLAHDLHIPVLCVVSFSRESVRRGGPPRMDDIRDSGGVESDADTVMLLWQEDERDVTTVDMVIDKNRYGIEGRLRFAKQGHRGRIADAKPEEGW